MEVPGALDHLAGSELLPVNLNAFENSLTATLQNSHTDIPNAPNYNYELYVSSMFQDTDDVIVPSRTRAAPRPVKELKKQASTRVRKVYPDKQKQQLVELQQQYEQMQQKLQALTLENFQLKCRSKVLHDMVACLDELQLVYQAQPQKAKRVETHEIIHMLALKQKQIQDLTDRLIKAVEGSEEAVRQVEDMVTQMNHQKVSKVPMHPNDFSLLLALHLHQAIPLLKVPEERHWGDVASALRLSPEQRACTLIALSLIDRPAPLGPPHDTPTSSSGSSMTDLIYRQQQQLTNALVDHDPCSSATTSSLSPPAPPPPYHSRSSPSTSTSWQPLPAPSTFHSCHSLPDVPAIEDLDRLDRHMVKFAHRAHLLSHYLHCKLLTPMQSARAHVSSYPFFANPFAILHALSKLPDPGTEGSKGAQSAAV